MSSSPPCRPSGRLVTAMRWISFTVAYVAVAIAFSMFASTVFLNAIKEQFGYSQSQVDLLLSLEWLGIGATLPAGTLIQRYGMRLGAVLGLVVPTAAHLLIWSACRHLSWYGHHYYILATYFFLAGCGCGISYLVAIATTLGNFHNRVRCTVVGVLSSATSVGPIVAIFVYDTFFLGASVYDNMGQDIEGYFLTLSLCFLVANALSVVTYGHYPPSDKTADTESDTDSENKPLLQEGQGKDNNNEEGHPKPEADDGEEPVQGLWQIMSNPRFHLILWPAVIILGLGPMDVNNLTTMLLSYGLERYSTSFPYLCSIVGFTGKLFMGGVSDLVVRHFPRSGFVVVAASCICVAFFLSALWLQHVTVVLINIVVVNMAAVVIWCIGPSILIEEFGERTFVRDWGFVQLGYGFSAFLWQYLFGVLYDLYVDDATGACYGQMCFLWIFIVSASLSALATLLSAVYLYKRWQTKGYELARTDSTTSLR